MSARVRARYLFESNFGRNDGWYIELDGSVVGELSKPTWEDQFWHSYAVEEPVHAERSVVLEDGLWNDSRFTFRSRRTKEVVTTAFCGGVPPFVRDGRVLMRRLYLLPNTVTERLWLLLFELCSKVRR